MSPSLAVKTWHPPKVLFSSNCLLPGNAAKHSTKKDTLCTIVVALTLIPPLLDYEWIIWWINPVSFTLRGLIHSKINQPEPKSSLTNKSGRTAGNGHEQVDQEDQRQLSAKITYLWSLIWIIYLQPHSFAGWPDSSLKWEAPSQVYSQCLTETDLCRHWTPQVLDQCLKLVWGNSCHLRLRPGRSCKTHVAKHRFT